MTGGAWTGQVMMKSMVMAPDASHFVAPCFDLLPYLYFGRE